MEIDRLLGAIAAYSNWAGPIVFIVALLESLALVGLFVPGAAFLTGIGLLIAAGTLSFWPMVLSAIAGAIVGDAISYELGRRFPATQTIHSGLWWRRAIERSRELLVRYGAWSVAFGRFVGPLRPVVPMVAGSLGVTRRKFYAACIASAVVWGPAYIGPGLIFGSALGGDHPFADHVWIWATLGLVVLWGVIFVARRRTRGGGQPKTSA